MKKILFLFSILTFVSCGMTQEEREAWEKERAEEMKEEMHFQGSYKTTVTVQYYDLDNCEYIGRLSNISSDFIAHSGQCKYCKQRQAHLLDSLIKKNLAEFFALSKPQ